MRCHEASERLIELVFGELDDTTEMRLHRHLLACAMCRSEEARLLEMQAATRGREPRLRPGMRERLRASLTRRPPLASTVLGWRVPAYGALLAGLCGVLLGAALPERGSIRIRPSVEPLREATAPEAPIFEGGRLTFIAASSSDTRVVPIRDRISSSADNPLRRDSL